MTNLIRVMSLFCVLCGVAFAQTSNGAQPQVTPGVVNATVDRIFGTSDVVNASFMLTAVGEGYFPFTVWVPDNYVKIVKVDPKGGFFMVGQAMSVAVSIDVKNLPLGTYQIPVSFVGQQGNPWNLTVRVDVNIVNSLYPAIGTPQESDRFVPHVAAGKDWTTVIRIMNPTDSEVKTYTQFNTQAGNPLELNINGFVMPSMAHVIKPNSVVQMTLTSTEELVMGNAIVKTISGPTPTVNVLYKQRTPARHSAVQMQAASASKMLYFDTRGRQSFGLAVGNNSAAARTVVVEFLSVDGVLVKAAAFVVPAFGSYVTTLDLDYPEVMSMEGLMRVKTDAASLSVFGLQFDLDSESFSSEN